MESFNTDNCCFSCVSHALWKLRSTSILVVQLLGNLLLVRSRKHLQGRVVEVLARVLDVDTQVAGLHRVAPVGEQNGGHLVDGVVANLGACTHNKECSGNGATTKTPISAHETHQCSRCGCTCMWTCCHSRGTCSNHMHREPFATAWRARPNHARVHRPAVGVPAKGPGGLRQVVGGREQLHSGGVQEGRSRGGEHELLHEHHDLRRGAGRDTTHTV